MKYGIKMITRANAGNHLHLQIQLGNRYTYNPFIRAVTSAIAMAVTGVGRWSKTKSKIKTKFWDRRPFTRIVIGRRAFLTVRDYVRVNQIEGSGSFRRDEAKFIVEEYRLEWNSA